jgi:hypothetical protein
MTDRSVIFKAQQVAEHEWQIVCHCPGGQIEYVTGFLDEQAIDKWLNDERREFWLTARSFHARQEPPS